MGRSDSGNTFRFIYSCILKFAFPVMEIGECDEWGKVEEEEGKKEPSV